MTKVIYLFVCNNSEHEIKLKLFKTVNKNNRKCFSKGYLIYLHHLFIYLFIYLFI